MGKKSIDETPGSDEHNLDAHTYLITEDAGALTQPSSLLKALVKALAGPERETEDRRERQERSMALRRRWEEQLARDREVSQVGSYG